MKIIVAPDSFKEALDSVAAAAAIANGIREVLPDAMIDLCPVGDGGEGTLGALHAAARGRLVSARVADMFGNVTDTNYGVFDDFVFIESAAVIGLALVPAHRRAVMRASSYGVGELMIHALQHAPAEVVVGVGGSATNDGGCGMAQALGIRFFDHVGELIDAPLSGGMLGSIGRIDATQCALQPGGIPVTLAADVDNPLTGPDGASRIYAPQKGADANEVRQLDDGLRHLAALLRRDLRFDVETVHGAGAAGGLGAGLLAFAHARRESGIKFVLDAIRFRNRVQGADLCITGEGRLDLQSLSGKACLGVAEEAARHRVPTVALTGSAGPGADRCLDAGIAEYVVIGEGLPVAESIRQTRLLLAGAAARVAAKYASQSVHTMQD